MRRYGRDLERYDRQFRGRGRAEPDRAGRARRYTGYDRAYQGGWGMTNLFNTVMRGGPSGYARREAEFYHRPRGTPYGTDFQRRPPGAHGDAGARSGYRSPDEGTLGVHYRGRSAYGRS